MNVLSITKKLFQLNFQGEYHKSTIGRKTPSVLLPFVWLCFCQFFVGLFSSCHSKNKYHTYEINTLTQKEQKKTIS